MIGVMPGDRSVVKPRAAVTITSHVGRGTMTSCLHVLGMLYELGREGIH